MTTTTAPARCPACGGALGTQAQWCGLCHADLRPAPPPAPPPVPPVAAATAAAGAPADTVPGRDAEREALLVAETLLAAARAEADRHRPGLPGGWGSRSARTGLAVGLGVLLMLFLVLGLFVLGSLV